LKLHRALACPRVHLRCSSVYGQNVPGLKQRELAAVSFDLIYFVCGFDALRANIRAFPDQMLFAADAGRAIESIAEAACIVRRR
jgi:hypothetical protein